MTVIPQGFSPKAFRPEDTTVFVRCVKDDFHQAFIYFWRTAHGCIYRAT